MAVVYFGRNDCRNYGPALVPRKKFRILFQLSDNMFGVRRRQTGEVFRFQLEISNLEHSIPNRVDIGWFDCASVLTNGEPVAIAESTISDLAALGIAAPKGMQPEELFGMASLTDPFNIALLAFGGLLIGFGTRYAGGCTSGHAISGLSNLQLPSLIAVIGFFIGGLTMTFIGLPLILK